MVMKSSPQKSSKFITNELRNLREKRKYDPPSVVISGAWNIPGSLSWCEKKGNGSRTDRGLAEIGSKIKRDVQDITENVISLDWSIITGGALGVDHYSTQKVYELGRLDLLLVMLPVKIDNYLVHLTESHMGRGIISRDQVEEVNKLLLDIKSESPESIYDESIFRNCHERSYYARNAREAYLGNSLCAFHVDDSGGTRDMIEKMLGRNKFAYVHRYEVLKDDWATDYKEHIYNSEKLPVSEGEIEEIFGLSKEGILPSLIRK